MAVRPVALTHAAAVTGQMAQSHLLTGLLTNNNGQWLSRDTIPDRFLATELRTAVVLLPSVLLVYIRLAFTCINV